ncbi:hypothetical protein ABFS82_14G216700 [Erythranthe guttata]
MDVPRIHNVLVIIFMMIGFAVMEIDIALGQHPKSPGIVSRCVGITNFIIHCSFYISKIYPYYMFYKPNERCCRYARKTDIQLFCKKFLTGGKDIIYYSNKVVDLADYCGNPVPRGFKCGNYISQLSMK